MTEQGASGAPRERRTQTCVPCQGWGVLDRSTTCATCGGWGVVSSEKYLAPPCRLPGHEPVRHLYTQRQRCQCECHQTVQKPEPESVTR